MRVSVTVALSAELASMLDAELAPPEKQRPASAGLAGKHGPRAAGRGPDAAARPAAREPGQALPIKNTIIDRYSLRQQGIRPPSNRPKCPRSNVIRGGPAVVVIYGDEEPR
jgi:hypothetical protein